MKLTNYQRIKKVMNWNYNRGVNSERCNDVYRAIIKQKFSSINKYYSQMDKEVHNNNSNLNL